MLQHNQSPKPLWYASNDCNITRFNNHSIPRTVSVVLMIKKYLIRITSIQCHGIWTMGLWKRDMLPKTTYKMPIQCDIFTIYIFDMFSKLQEETDHYPKKSSMHFQFQFQDRTISQYHTFSLNQKYVFIFSRQPPYRFRYSSVLNGCGLWCIRYTSNINDIVKVEQIWRRTEAISFSYSVQNNFTWW